MALDSYLAALVGDLRESAEGIGDLLSLDTVPIVTDADSAVTIGVIVTELVINAMKNAYPESTGPIRVRLEAADPPPNCRLVVEDDGVGREATTPKASEASTGIGRTIIDAMASKLSATVAYEGAVAGTRAVVVFAVADPQSPGPMAAMTPAEPSTTPSVAAQTEILR